MKIRKYSVAWFATRKPLQVAVLGLAVIGLLNRVPVAVAEPEIMPHNAEKIEVVQFIENDENEPENVKIDVQAYNVPLPDDVKEYAETLSKINGVDVAIIYGIIATESNFNADAIGDNGNSVGLMQIQPRWNRERMNLLNVTDLHDAKQNIAVGVDIFSELVKKYGDIKKALICFNYGEQGAEKYVFSKGITETDYTRAVLSYADSLNGEACF